MPRCDRHQGKLEHECKDARRVSHRVRLRTDIELARKLSESKDEAIALKAIALHAELLREYYAMPPKYTRRTPAELHLHVQGLGLLEQPWVPTEPELPPSASEENDE